MKTNIFISKAPIIGGIILFFAISIFSSCDPEPDPAELIVGLNWRNDFEGKSGPQISGAEEDLPQELSVNSGSTVLFSIKAAIPEGSTVSSLSLNIEASGVSKTADINIEEYTANGSFSFSYAHPAEASFEAYVTAFLSDGTSLKKGPLKVTVTAANATIVTSGALIAAPNTCSYVSNNENFNASYFFAAPYYAADLSSYTSGMAFGCSSATALSSIEDDRSNFALWGAFEANGSTSFVGADIFKSNGYLAEYFEKYDCIGMNAVVFEKLDVPAETAWPINTNEFQSRLSALNYATYENLDTMAVINASSSITIEDMSWIKFKTINDKKGVILVRLAPSGKAVGYYSNIQR